MIGIYSHQFQPGFPADPIDRPCGRFPPIQGPGERFNLPPKGSIAAARHLPGSSHLDIVFSDASVSFAGRPALHALSLTLSERRIGIIGLNGSGKTTFARMINGLVRPTAGRVSVGGLDTVKDEEAARGRAMERFENEFPESPDAEDERILCQCFRRLLPLVPEQYREVLEEIDLKRKKPGEVAAKLGLTRNNLTVRLHRARKHLRDALSQNCRACSTHGCLDCTCEDSSEQGHCH